MRHLAAELSWNRLEALARSGACALLPVGSTEAHGPHLPLSVDVVIAEEVCRRVSLRLEREAVQFPSVTYSLTDFAAPFPGTVTLSPEVARSMLEQVVVGIARAGFSVVALVNHHLEPAHFRLVHEAAKRAAESSGVLVVVPDHRRAPLGPALGEEFMHGGSHAGCYETSLMLAAAPGLVDEVVRALLPEVAVDLPQAIRAGARTFLDCGGTSAYFGAPGAASAEEGHRLFELIADATAATIAEAGSPANASR
jgi:creatinine amidohydrolase